MSSSHKAPEDKVFFLCVFSGLVGKFNVKNLFWGFHLKFIIQLKPGLFAASPAQNLKHKASPGFPRTSRSQSSVY